MAVCLINLESDASVLDLLSMSFGNTIVAMASRDTVECLQWQDCYHYDGHHQRTDGAPHTPSPDRMHIHMQLNPKRGRCEFRPTFRGYTGTLGGVINKREDGDSVDSNEVARHAHGKRFTGARPESEPVASLTIECYEEEPAGNWARFYPRWQVGSGQYFDHRGSRGSSLKARQACAGAGRLPRCPLSSGRGSRPDACALKPETGSVNGLRPADATGFFRAGTLSTAGAHPDVMRLQAVR